MPKGNDPRQKLEGEQKRGEKIKEEGNRRRRTKAGETEPAMTFGVAEEATIASAGDNRACSNGGSQKNEHSGSTRTESRSETECGASSKKGPFCNGGRPGQELLCMRRIQTHSLLLQKLGSEGKSGGE